MKALKVLRVLVVLKGHRVKMEQQEVRVQGVYMERERLHLLRIS
jgi:hypothetical protein